MFNRHSRIAANFFSATVMLAGFSFAADAAETQSVSIQSSDLDLASEAGRAVLQLRIDHAVDKVCGSPHVRTTGEVQNYATCSKEARTAAAAQFDAAVAAAQNARKVATDRNNVAALR